MAYQHKWKTGWLAFGRRFQMPKCKTNCHKLSSVPASIKLLNNVQHSALFLALALNCPTSLYVSVLPLLNAAEVWFYAAELFLRWCFYCALLCVCLVCEAMTNFPQFTFSYLVCVCLFECACACGHDEIIKTKVVYLCVTRSVQNLAPFWQRWLFNCEAFTFFFTRLFLFLSASSLHHIW